MHAFAFTKNLGQLSEPGGAPARPFAFVPIEGADETSLLAEAHVAVDSSTWRTATRSRCTSLAFTVRGSAILATLFLRCGFGGAPPGEVVAPVLQRHQDILRLWPKQVGIAVLTGAFRSDMNDTDIIDMNLRLASCAIRAVVAAMLGRVTPVFVGGGGKKNDVPAASILVGGSGYVHTR